MGAFRKDQLPDWQTYADGAGLTLIGRTTWRTTACDFHGGSDSLRVNVHSGGWVCMACGASGGDVLAHYMELSGEDFVSAAKALGAWDETEQATTPLPPKLLPARDAMQVMAMDVLTLVPVIADVRRGVTPSDADWAAFLQCAGRIEALAAEFRP